MVSSRRPEEGDQKREPYARHLVSTVPGLEVGRVGGVKALSNRNPALNPKAELGLEAQYGSRETWQHREETERGSSRQGPPDPRKVERRFEGTDTGAQGLIVLRAAWQGWHTLP